MSTPSKWQSLPTEQINPASLAIDKTPVRDIIDMIVNEESGLLVPRGDVEALAADMRRLIADPDLRERLGRAAAVRSALFTADVAIPILERLYGDLTGGRTVLPAEA